MAFLIEVDDAGMPDDDTDNNQCGVIAVAHALRLTYTASQALLAVHGREHGTGTTQDMWKSALDSLGVTYASIGTGLAGLLTSRTRIGPFTREHPEGIYLVVLGRHPRDRLPAHMIAIINGVVYDADWDWVEQEPWQYAAKQVLFAWRIEHTTGTDRTFPCQPRNTDRRDR